MNKIILDKLKLEFETTDISLDGIASKYNIDTKQLKGSNKWRKNILNPKTKAEKKAHIDTHIDLLSNVEIVACDELLLAPDPDKDSLMDAKIVRELTDELATDLIIQASKDVIDGNIPQLPEELKDGFVGLRKLDKTLQEQAHTFLMHINHHLTAIDVGDTKSLRDLAAIHTSIRDSYFNSKNTMISVINGDVTQTNNTMNNLVGFLAEVESDC